MNLSLAFKECYLAKILNLDTKAIAYLLFHTEEILDSVFIKKKSKSSPKQPLLFGTRFVRQGFGWFISSSLLIGGLREEEYLIFKGLQGQILFMFYLLWLFLFICLLKQILPPILMCPPGSPIIPRLVLNGLSKVHAEELVCHRS